MSTSFNWSSFEEELGAELHAALHRLARESNGESFYACTLMAGYREEDGILCLPMLAVASESNSAPPDEDGFWGARWNSADWSHPELELAGEACLRLEKALCAEACRSTPLHWKKVEQRLSRLLVRLARRIRDVFPSLLPTTPDFVCFVSDEELGFDLAAQSIPQALVRKLFAPQIIKVAARNGLDTMGDDERARYLVTRFGRFDGISTEVAQAELLKMGTSALPALIDRLGDRAQGWTAAMLIGKIGIADPVAIATLRKSAPQSHWHSTALGMLGDHAWLSSQDFETAVNGLCARFKAISQGEWPPPLDYGPLERFLDNADEETLALVEKELKPGSSYVAIAASDAAEAVRGMRSNHAVIRWHAASVAGERSLGRKAGALLLPILASLLEDRHPLVRRLAVLNIGRWKAQAREFKPSLEKLIDDPDESVARSTQVALRQIC